MNHLAHIYLSEDNTELLIGNYIADFVKGKQIKNFSRGVQKGIVLHRAIDSFTDKHPIVKNSVLKFRPKLRKYAGIAVDVVYDHYLALHWNDFHQTDLQVFANEIYALLEDSYEQMPFGAQRFYQYMTSKNLLYNYQHIDAIQRVFSAMANRSTYESNLDKSVPILEKHYEELEEEFRFFFNDLENFVKEEKAK